MRCAKRDNQRWLSYSLLAGTIVLFMLTRCVFLDRDLPPNGISSYVAVDEMYYTIPAFNLYHHGDATYNDITLLNNYSSKDMQPTNILENMLTYVSLSLFGNDYYGLRFASTIAAFISFILIYLILRRILDSDSATHNHMLYFIMVYLVFDFAFMMAGRVAEPTIFRLMAMLVVIYIGSLSCFSGSLESKYHSMFLGFLSMAAVLYVYLYNVFIFAAMLLTVIVWAKKSSWENALKQTALFFIGSLVCMALYQGFAGFVYNSSLAEVYMYVAPYQNRMGMETGSIDSIRLYLTNAFAIPMTNIFRFNIIFLLALLVSLPVFIEKVKTEQTNFDVMIFNLSLFLVMQSVVINDYPLRKLTMILPLAVIIIAISFSKKRFGVYSKRLPNEKARKVTNLYLFTCYLICLSIWIIYFVPISQSEHFAEVYVSMYINLIVFLIVSSFLLKWLREDKQFPAPYIWLCLILVLLPNIYLVNQYVFSNRTYYYRNAMIEMAGKINGEITVGGCSYGFRLYNRSTPVLNAYTGQGAGKTESYNSLFDSLFEQKTGRYSIAYTNDDQVDSPMGAAYMEEHGLELVEEYELGDAVGTNVGLYSVQR